MNTAALRRAAFACLAMVAVATVVLMMPTARLSANSSGVLNACVNPGNGMMRLVDSSAACHDNETFVEWNIAGPQGPQGPQGPAGPQGSSAGGPPFVWVCTPAFTPGEALLGNNIRMDLYVFNGSSSSANVAVHILDKDGNNLAGVGIPGVSSPPLTYPGQTGSATVSVASLQTLITSWQLPSDAPTGGPNVSTTVQVVSDQSTVVSSGFSGVGPPVPCSLLPK